MKRSLTLLLVVVALVAGSCGGADPVSRTAIDMGEYTISPDDTVLAAGAITLELMNSGELPHTIVVSHKSGEVVAASDVLQGGETQDFTVRLEPGEYEFTCRIVAEFDGELIDHYELGMVETVSVRG